jgi:hypothetical protein
MTSSDSQSKQYNFRVAPDARDPAGSVASSFGDALRRLHVCEAPAACKLPYFIKYEANHNG